METKKTYYQYIMDTWRTCGKTFEHIAEIFAEMGFIIQPESINKGYKRGNMPKKIGITEFYDSVIYDSFCNDEQLKEFAALLIYSLKTDNVPLPDNWDERIKSIDGSQSFDLNEFKLFIISLLKKNIIVKNDVTPRNFVCSTKKDFNTLYYPQTLFNPENGEKLFEIEKADFTQLKKDRLILIEGEGGLGKTTFIKKISALKASQQEFKNIITLSLANYVDYVSKAENDTINNDNTDHVTFFDYISNLKTDAIDVHSIIDEDSKTLLILDGFNEAYAFCDTESRNKVITELQYLKNQYNNICFVVTSRPSEGNYSFKKSEFLKDFSVYYLSGVSKEDFDKFCSNHPDLPKEILEIAKIPLYFTALNKTENLDKIKTENDLLKEIYYLRYKQSLTKHGAKYSFAAFYILAPALANYMSLNRRAAVSYAEILNISKKLFVDGYWSTTLLNNVAVQECPTSEFPPSYDYEEICKMLTQNGPLVTCDINSETRFDFFHQEIRKYLLAYYAWMSISATQLAVSEENFSFIQNLVPNLNLDFDTIQILKQRLGFCCSNEAETIDKIKAFFCLEDAESENFPQQIIFYHNAFLFSEYLGYRGLNFLSAFHGIIAPIVQTVSELIETNAWNYYIDGIDSQGKTYCKICFLDLLCKECQYYRESQMYTEGEKCIAIAKTIDPEDDAVNHQSAKLKLAFYEKSLSTRQTIESTNSIYGFDCYETAMNVLNASAKNGFIFSSNLLSMILSVPSHILIKQQKDIKIDYVQAFYVLYVAIKKAIKQKAFAMEIDYSIRQAVSLLLKGYVRIKEGCTYQKNVFIQAEQLSIGGFNTFDIDIETLKFAKHLLSFVDGLYRPSLDYFRAIIKYYEGAFDEAKCLLKNEENLILNQIFLKYKFEESYNIDESINSALKKRSENNTKIDSCDPIYWGLIDAMNLELSLNINRKEFYDNYIEGLDAICKKMVELSRQ